MPLRRWGGKEGLPGWPAEELRTCAMGALGPAFSGAGNGNAHVIKCTELLKVSLQVPVSNVHEGTGPMQPCRRWWYLHSHFHRNRIARGESIWLKMRIVSVVRTIWCGNELKITWFCLRLWPTEVQGHERILFIIDKWKQLDTLWISHVL